jgi:hypothetical protein
MSWSKRYKEKETKKAGGAAAQRLLSTMQLIWGDDSRQIDQSRQQVYIYSSSTQFRRPITIPG